MVNYIFFWGADKNYGFLSNFYMSPLCYNGHQYHCSEQLYMWLKAKYFDDEEIAAKICLAKTPREAKILGRQVKGFQEGVWSEVRRAIMYETLMCKFSSNQLIKNLLLDTGDDVLVEASPKDNVWGTGMSEEEAINLGEWPGQNLLGKVLMDVRATLSNGLKYAH